MFIVIPILSLLLIYGFIRLKGRTDGIGASRRGAFLCASVAWFFLLTAATEVLSLFHLITFGSLAAFWVVVTLIMAWACVYQFEKHGLSKAAGDGKVSVLTVILVGAAVVLVLGVGLVAFLSPTNNWDSMVYHMPKVLHWMQNQSVDFYPTHVLRQNHQNPGAEYIILHFQILSGSDRFANFVQWYAMAGSMLGASLIAKRLGARACGQVLAAVFAGTFPMGIMQASSTQTDLAAGFGLICVAYFTLYLVSDERRSVFAYAMFGIALGLAILVKATAYIFALPFVIWLTAANLKAFRVKAVIPLLIAGVFVLLVNMGHYTRNYGLYGHPLGPMTEGEGGEYSNLIYTPKAFASNVLRNAGVHFIGTPIPAVNEASAKAVISMHEWMGADVNDKRTTFADSQFTASRHIFNDEVDGNPVHFILIFLSYLAIAIFSKVRKSGIVMYGLAVLAGFVVFCLYLQWNAWTSRTQTPLFVMWAPFVGCVIGGLIGRKATFGVGMALILLAGPWLFLCVHRPLVGSRNIFNTSRERLYFGMPMLKYEEPYMNAADFMKDKNFRRIGFVLGGDAWEYPLLMLFKEAHPDLQFQHVNVGNVSKVFYQKEPFKRFTPDAVVTVHGPGKPEITVDGQSYKKQWSQGSVTIYYD